MVTHNMSNSLATLCNIGNSCYMNSVLYTLRFAPNFTHNLHHLVEFLELVLQKLTADRKCPPEHANNRNAHNQPNAAQVKPKSSSLGRNIPGLHGSSGHSWSSKDLVSLEGSANGYDTPSVGNAVAPNTVSGAFNDISDANKCNVSGYNTPSLGGNSIGNAYSTSSGNVCIGAREPENGVTGGPGTKTNRQLVCETLHELFHSLSRNEATDAIEPFHAGGLLQAVQSVSTTFEGNQQQDAHEFLMCILDSVRESCQTLNGTLLENPDILKNSSYSSVAPMTGKDAAVDVNNVLMISAVPESKSSGTPFMGRNIFRRRKESLKNTKAFLSKECRSVTMTDSLFSVQTSAGGNSLETLPANEITATPKTNATVQESSTVDERLKERIRTLGLNFFCEDFEGVTVSRTRCLSCETVTEQKETMIDIAIPITTNEMGDAVKNPQQFYQDACITQEYFRGDNKYRCEVCSGYTEACRTISFDILPRLLVLQLKRFNGDMEKINSYIPTPFVLQCFCRDCFGKTDNEKRHVYRLYSVITHVGARMSVGHYIAYTSSLEIPLQYINCVKDRQRRVLLAAAASIDGQHPLVTVDGVANGGGLCAKAPGATDRSASGQLKKLFGGKKASSAGDISKKLKNNVISRFSPSNGIANLQLNGNAVLSLEKPTTTGSNDNFYSIHSTNPNVHHPLGTCNDFPLNGNQENGTNANAACVMRGGKSFNSNGMSCQSVGCCAVLTKPLTTNNPPPLAHHSDTGSASVIGDAAKANCHHLATHASGSVVPCAPTCTHHTNYHVGLSNGDGARPAGTLITGGCQNASPMNNLTNSGDTNEHGIGSNDGRESASAANQQLTWYMCDDDKIKIMTQLEFEEILSPNRRHVITPYLLFYARYDVHQKQTQQPQHPQSQPPSPSQQQPQQEQQQPQQQQQQQKEKQQSYEHEQQRSQQHQQQQQQQNPRKVVSTRMPTTTKSATISV